MKTIIGYIKAFIIKGGIVLQVIIIALLVGGLYNASTKMEELKAKIVELEAINEWIETLPNEEDIDKWYVGGTLHSATFPEWQAATIENKMATAFDWALIVKEASKAWKANGTDAVKPFAKELIECMDNLQLQYKSDYDAYAVAYRCVDKMNE